MRENIILISNYYFERKLYTLLFTVFVCCKYILCIWHGVCIGGSWDTLIHGLYVNKFPFVYDD